MVGVLPNPPCQPTSPQPRSSATMTRMFGRGGSAADPRPGPASATSAKRKHAVVSFDMKTSGKSTRATRDLA